MRYAIVIEKAENNYAAYVPDLPGCVATGQTIEETEQEIREAIDRNGFWRFEDCRASADTCRASASCRAACRP